MLIKFVYNQRKEVRKKEREILYWEKQRERKIEGYFDERESVHWRGRERRVGEKDNHAIQEYHTW